MIKKVILSLLILLSPIKIYSQDSLLIGNELGILEAVIESYKEYIMIYNEDGTIWMQFDFDYENKVNDKYNYDGFAKNRDIN